MSTILKALQRLEDEKTADVERSLDEQIVEHRSPREPARRHGLGIGIAAIGGLAVAVAAFLLWPTQEDSDAVVAIESPPLAAAPAAAPKPAQPAAPAKPRRQRPARTAPAAPERAESPEIEIAEVVEVVERLDAQPADSGAPAASQERVAPAAETKRSDRRPSARKPDTRVADKPEPPRPAPRRARKAESPAIQSAEAPVAPAAESSLSTKAAAAPSAPVEIAAVAPEPAPMVDSEPIPAPIREPAQKIVQRAKVPSLSIEKTIWHPDTNRRIAVVRLIGTEEVLRLKEGDAIGPLVVESIRPSSVVFNHDGIEISFNVGS